MLIQSALAIGPALVPLGAQAIPVVAGLTAELGAAAAAAGVTALAFWGVGDAVKAVRDYQLQPTEAHLQKMQETLDALGPAGRDFVHYISELRPQLQGLQDVAQAGMLPGVEDGINMMLTRLPDVERVIATISSTLGQLSREAGQSLGGPEWDAFFSYIESDARPLLLDLSRTMGNVVLGIANMMQAFGPMSLGFSDGLLAMSRDFAAWSATLESSQGFQHFAAYVEETGPKVWDTLGALAQAMLAIVEAAAPVGEVSLPIITALANVIAAIASSPIGPVLIGAAAGFSAIARAVALFEAANGSALLSFMRGADGGPLAKVGSTAKRSAGGVRQLTADLSIMATTATTAGARTERELARTAAAGERVKATLAPIGKGAAVVGGLALATSGLSDQMGLANTTSLALMGTLAGPWGAAVGAGVGLTMDLAAANNNLEDAVAGANRAMGSTNVDQMRAQLDALDTQIAATKDKLTVHFSANPFSNFAENSSALIAGTNELATGSLSKAEAARAALAKQIDSTTMAAARAVDTYTGAVGRAGIAAGLTTSEVNGLVAAMNEQRDAALSAFDAETRYRSALKSARAQAGKNDAGIRGSSDAAIQNRQALSELAAAWNNQSAAVQNNTAKFRAARSAYIDTAVAMGVPIDRARELAHSIYDIPRQRVVQIAMTGGDAALAELKRIKQEVTSIPRQWSTTYYVTQVNRISKPAALPGNPDGQGADGTFVPKTGLPYADRWHYLLADGEGVTTNRHGETDMFRDVIAAINAGYDRAAVKGMLANGGFAGHPRYVPPPQPSTSHGSVTVDIDALRITGTLKTSFGPADVEGIATVAARNEIAADRRFQRVRHGR
ncbi:hypothetical protein [Nocardioides sp.]|uniref:hypothetical protein n=1 Tax=Nocardioides sp. TaxID=35761 RepID=UPI003783FF18